MKTKKPELLKMQLLLLMLFIFSSIQAQRWRLGGNSNLPAADDITAPGANQFGSQAGFNIPINFITNGVQRMNLRALNNLNPIWYPSGNNAGYLALGDPSFNSPLFHLSVQTPSLNGFGEMLIGGSISDVPRSYAALYNPTTGNNLFLPTFLGYLDSSQAGPAISTLGNIDPINDVAPTSNNAPVHRFIVSKGIRLYTSGAADISEINNRVAFTWQNNSTIKMMMNAAGRLRIGSALNIPANLPNNRVEITSSAGAIPALNDPYFGTVNGSSGLRFTNLTSNNTPVPNGTNGVNSSRALTVDQNGDVVLVTVAPTLPAQNSNNGVFNNVGVFQLGVPCSSPIGVKVANGLTTNRMIHLLGNNFVFADGGRVGFGLPPISSCAVGNKVEIRATNLDPYANNVAGWGASGLRLGTLTSANNPVPNGTNGANHAKVLSVDANGDVILVPNTVGASIINANNGTSNNGGNIQLGGDCGTPASVTAGQLVNNRDVFLNNNNLIISETTTGTGKVGIGNIAACTPGNLLEVSKNNTTPNAAGLSGLRLTDLKAGAGTVPSNGRVLTVNSNGDVVLTTDQIGTGGGGVNAQNGLTLFGLNTVELGGTLIKPTAIDFNGFQMRYHNGANLNLYVRDPNGGYYMKADGANVYAGSGIVGFFEDFTAKNIGWNIGRELNVSASSSAISPAFTGLVGNLTKVNTSGFTVVGDIYGDWAQSTNANGTGGNIAGKFDANGNSSMTKANVGVRASAGGANNNYCIYTEISNPPQAIEDNGVRVFSQSNLNTTTNIAGYFKALQGVNTYGIYAEANGGTTTNYAGYFQGDVYINGPSQVAGLALTASDLTFKTNIDTISNVKSLISQLKPRTFYYDTLNSAGINFTSKKQYGLIAQDVELLLPELVGMTTKPAERDSLGNITIPATTYKNLNYNAFIAILIKGMQEQQKTIDSLKVKTSKQDSINNAVQAQIAALTSSVSSCCSNSSVRTTKPEEVNQLTIDLSDKDIIVLNQNVPNPFAEQTTITYNVPEKYGYAQIIFSTIEGKIIKAVDITKKGRGQLNVFASDLSSGMYTYSLVVDGKIIGTKKMVKSE